MEERPPGDPFDVPEEPSSEAPRASIADGVKRAIVAGMGALFMTEDGARRLARDWKLPKELIGFVGQQAQAAKDEILRVFAGEFRRFLESEGVRKEFWKGLAENTIELQVRIRVRPDGAGDPRPAVEASARRRPRKGKK